MSVADRMRAWLGRRPAVVADPRLAGPAAWDAATPADAATVADEYRAQLGALEAARRSAAEVLVARKRLETSAAQLRRSHDELEARARAAAREGRDDLARSALTRALQLERQLADRQKTIDDLHSRERDLSEACERLQGFIETYRVRMEAATARHESAEAVARVELASATARQRTGAGSGAPINPGTGPETSPDRES